MAAAISIPLGLARPGKDHRAFIYAQVHGGQKLHIAEKLADGTVETLSFCGLTPERWCMTINVPLGYACGNCLRSWEARHR